MSEESIRADVVLAEVRAGFLRVHAEMADIKADHLRMHAENRAEAIRQHGETSDRLDTINGKVNRAHERLAKHDGLISALQRRVESVAKGVHEKFNALWTQLDARFQQFQDGNGSDFMKVHMTPDTLWKIVVAIAATAATTYWVLIASGWHRGTP